MCDGKLYMAINRLQEQESDATRECRHQHVKFAGHAEGDCRIACCLHCGKELSFDSWLRDCQPKRICC